jgi:hypothetical protein
MGLASLASTLYSIQSRKNIPLRTAFSMMVREDLATRFSVFNLTKTITKSEFLATLAHAKFGSLTPMQKMEEQEKKKAAALALKKEKRLEKFQRFTVGSIAGLNNKINMLSAITEKNTGLINSLYNDLGYFKNQRSININNVNPKSIRAPLRKNTVKNQIDEINKQIDVLKNTKLKPSKKPSEKKKTKKEIKETGLLDSVVESLTKNPLFLLALTKGVGKAIGIGTIAAQLGSLLSLPKTVGNIMDRLGGKSLYDDPTIEKISQYATTGAATLGTYTAVRGSLAIGNLVKNYMNKKNPNYARDTRMKQMNEMTKGFQKKGLSYKDAQKKAGERYKKITGVSKFLKKWKVIGKILRGASKALPALMAADVVFEIARISNYVSDHANGKMHDTDFKKNVSRSLTEISSTVGFSAMGGIIGSVAGSGLFPGIGTLAGGLIGAGVGAVTSILVPEESMDEVGTKLFELFFEGKAAAEKTEPAPAASTPAAPTQAKVTQQPYTPPKEFVPQVGTLGAMPLQTIPADTQKILETIRKKESSGNYKAIAKGSTASGAYQFIDSTWRAQAKAAGIGTEYPSAYLAPPQIQDAVAAHYVETILKNVNGDVTKVPLVWYTGNASGKMSANQLEVNKGLTSEKYQADWLKLYAKNSPAKTATMQTVSVVEPPSIPTNAAVQLPPAAEAAKEVVDGTNKNAEIQATAAIQSVARMQGQLNAVSTETIRTRQKMLESDEFPSAMNADMERYA